MSQTQRPFIGINVDFKVSQRGVPSACFVFSGYIDCILKAGAVPMIFPPVASTETLDMMLAKVDGLLFVGGGDLDPRNDGFMLHTSVRPMAQRREKFDRMLMAAAEKRRLPVLGVGAGMQLLNVSQGGTLFLHIPEDVPRALPHRDWTDGGLRHGLVVEKGSLLDSVYGDSDVRVNSVHHMAVDDVAPNFLVTARCPSDNVVEAIESTRDDWFAVGVQFHPESLAATVLDQHVFHEFVKGVVSFKETGRNPYPWSPSRPEKRSPSGGSASQSLFSPSDSSDSSSFI